MSHVPAEELDESVLLWLLLSNLGAIVAGLVGFGMAGAMGLGGDDGEGAEDVAVGWRVVGMVAVAQTAATRVISMRVASAVVVAILCSMVVAGVAL